MNKASDIVIHINEELNHQNRHDLTREMKKNQGVVSASLNDNKPHLMIVAYNNQETRAFDILNNVKRQGMHAQLVGWL